VPPELSGIPASALLPSTIGGSNIYWEPKSVPDNGSERLALASGFSAGYRYYTKNQQLRLSKTPFPDDVWRSDIRYAYGHGPDKGEGKQELDTPCEIWMCRMWHIERKCMVVGIIPSYPVRAKISRLFENDQLIMTDSMLANFFFTFYKAKKGSGGTSKTDYDVTATVKPCTSPDALKAAAEPWYPDNFWNYQSPFEEPADDRAAARPERPEVPLTTRDGNGADVISNAPNDAAPDSDDDTAW
jgi:hypothetical protein